MRPSSLVKLVHSLSGSEKRHFKLQSKMQNGSKEYLLLFELIDRLKSPDVQPLKEAFKKRSPKGSWENTCTYLGNVLVESLVTAKKQKDNFFGMLHQLQEIKILKERSLDELALKQAKNLQQKAAKHQLYWIEYYCCRYELDHYSDNNFAGINDERLIKLQMKAKDILKNVSHIHDHYSLYELLQSRLVHAGKIVSEEGKKTLNDLMLSEMALVAGKSKSFTSQKLHLLFQSFFFTVVGDYHSALKSFHHLNELMEKHEAFLDNPPLDYLSALNGIVDSLRMLKNKTETAYYLEKIKRLDQPLYPEYFRYLVRKIYYTQETLTLLLSNQPDQAERFVADIPQDVFDSYATISEAIQSELYFYCSLVYFQFGNWRKAHLFIRKIMNQLKLPQHLLISKAIRLLNILIYYEKGELLHLEYEVRSYKRHFGQSKLLRTEKLIFKILGRSSINKRLLIPVSEQRRILQDLETVANDRYEQQLLKYLDLTRWIKNEVMNKKTGPGPRF